MNSISGQDIREKTENLPAGEREYLENRIAELESQISAMKKRLENDCPKN